MAKTLYEQQCLFFAQYIYIYVFKKYQSVRYCLES